MAEDALDALAPSAPAAPAAPVSVPPSPAPPSSAAAPSAPAPVAAPAAPESAAQLQSLAKDLGYESADEMRADLHFSRRARMEFERAESLRRQHDPSRQQAAQRGEAFRQLVGEGYSPEHEAALRALPQFKQFLDDQRAEGAQREMDQALGELGITFTESKESQELRTAWEDRISDTLNANRRLNDMYFGSPAERRAALKEIIGHEERRINDVLLRQNAATLRDHAQRQAPRGTRGAASMPQVRVEKPTATDPVQRRREGNQIASRQLDDIWQFNR